MLQAVVAHLSLVVAGVVLLRIGIGEVLRLGKILQEPGRKLLDTEVRLTALELLLLTAVWALTTLWVIYGEQ